MSNLIDSFKDTYLVHYSLTSSNKIEVHKAYPFVEITNDYGGSFLGAKGSSAYGIRFTSLATHVGIFDLSDPDKPILIHSFVFEKMDPYSTNLVKARSSYIVFQRGLKNYKVYISEYPSRNAQRKAIRSQAKAKKTPQTIKAQKSLNNFKHKKAN